MPISPGIRLGHDDMTAIAPLAMVIASVAMIMYACATPSTLDAQPPVESVADGVVFVTTGRSETAGSSPPDRPDWPWHTARPISGCDRPGRWHNQREIIGYPPGGAMRGSGLIHE